MFFVSSKEKLKNDFLNDIKALRLEIIEFKKTGQPCRCGRSVESAYTHFITACNIFQAIYGYHPYEKDLEMDDRYGI
jgi:hypothetical protein